MNSQDDDITVLTSVEFLYSIKSQDGETLPIKESLSIGRSPNNDLKIEDKKISRNHAELKVTNDSLHITDLNSGNGTFVNGKKIDTITALKNNDVISFENHTFTIGMEIKEEKNDTNAAKIDKTVEDKIENNNEITTQPNEVHKNMIEENTDKNKNDDIPSSWTEEEGTVNKTRMMGSDELAKLRAGGPSASTPNVVKKNELGITQIHCFIDGVEEIFELPVHDEDSVSGWEIGRDSSCDITIDHSSVSGRHAQVVHQNGRWKIVNLVSTNGILINEQRKLSTYLADGDTVGLGSVNLVFNIPNSTKKSVKKNNSNKSEKSSKSLLMPIMMFVLLIALAVIVYLLLK